MQRIAALATVACRSLLHRSKKAPEGASHRADYRQEAGDHHPNEPSETAVHGVEPTIHLVSEVPHVFPEVAEVLSQVRIPFPDIGQLDSLLLTTDFQQLDPFFKIRHVSPPDRVFAARFYIVGSQGSCRAETLRNGAVRVEGVGVSATAKARLRGRICTPLPASPTGGPV